MDTNWSRWFRCESSFGLLLVPNQPGIFALAEEIVQPAGPYSRRMLAVFEVGETDDLARALSRLYTPSSPWRERLAAQLCYLRYAVLPDAEERRSADAALRNWLNSQREVASQIFESKPAMMPADTKPPIAVAEPRQPVARVGDDTERLEPFEAGEMRSERRIARAEHDGEAAQRGAHELKTVAERAVDRVTHRIKLAKLFPAGF